MKENNLRVESMKPDDKRRVSYEKTKTELQKRKDDINQLLNAKIKEKRHTENQLNTKYKLLQH